MNRKPIISKGTYMMGLRCPKSLYLKLNHKDLYESESRKMSAFALAAGLDFEQNLLPLIAPNGVDITKIHNHLDFDSYIQETKDQLKKRNINIYQATFQSKGKEQVMADAIRKKGDKVELIEVKGTSKLMDHHYYDCAFQLYCIENSGQKIDKVFLAYVNKDYIRNAKLEKDMAIMLDVTQKTRQLQNIVKMRIEQMRKVIRAKEAPSTNIGFHCTDPYPCIFKDSCWKAALPQNNVFEIANLWMKEKMNLYWAGIISMQQAYDRNIRVNEKQMLQIKSALSGDLIFDKLRVKEWLDQFKGEKEMFFLDFETIGYSAPRFTGGKPFQPIPIQYSVHHRDCINQKISHFEFLADPKKNSDQRLVLAKNLLEVLRPNLKAPILAYNKSFEAGRLRYLAEEFPALKKQIWSIISRLYDLADVFREKWYYHPDFKGSYSIKYILPVLCPELSYKNMLVQNGDQASSEFLKLEKSNCSLIRKALLDYCKLDTWAMVRIYDALLTKCQN